MSSSPEYHFDFTAPVSEAGLARCRAAMEGSELYEKLPDRLRFAADLSLDELATNTIKYGNCGDTLFTFGLRYVEGMLSVKYTDRGSPFDPWKLAVEKLALQDDTADPEIGGRGLMMMKEISAATSYEWTDGSNVI